MERISLYTGAVFAFISFLLIGLFVTRYFLKKKGIGGVKTFLQATNDKDEAAQSLLVYLNDEFSRIGKEIAVYDGAHTADESGWIFFWDTRDFVETKNPAYGFKGSNPVLYDKGTGRIQFIPQHEVFKYFGEKKES